MHVLVFGGRRIRECHCTPDHYLRPARWPPSDPSPSASRSCPCPPPRLPCFQIRPVFNNHTSFPELLVAKQEERLAASDRASSMKGEKRAGERRNGERKKRVSRRFKLRRFACHRGFVCRPCSQSPRPLDPSLLTKPPTSRSLVARPGDTCVWSA